MNFGRIFLGLLLAAVGTLFLLDGFEVLDAGRTISTAWPVVLIAAGAVQLAERRRPAAGPIILVVAGLILLGSTTGVAELAWDLVWPAALVALGIWLLVRKDGASRDGEDGGDRIQATAVLGGREVRSSSRAFEGGSLTAVLGGLDVDLRDTELAKGGAVLEITTIMGGIDLVPDTWRVDVRAATILGGIDDTTSRLSSSADAPTLTITGLLLMGGGDIRN